MRLPGRLRTASIAIVAASTAGCAWLSPEAPAGCGFPDGTALSFAGEASLTDLGLGERDIVAAGAITDATVGMIYVTKDAIPFSGSVPDTPNGPAIVPEFRQYCADFGDAMKMGGVPDDWSPPPPRR
jgi:hypothetical protein